MTEAPETRISLSRAELDRVLEVLALAPTSKPLDADLWPKLVRARARVESGKITASREIRLPQDRFDYLQNASLAENRGDE